MAKTIMGQMTEINNMDMSIWNLGYQEKMTMD